MCESIKEYVSRSKSMLVDQRTSKSENIFSCFMCVIFRVSEVFLFFFFDVCVFVCVGVYVLVSRREYAHCFCVHVHACV